jgi:hypothetical protein
VPTPDAIAASIKFRNRLAKEEAASFARMSRLYVRIITVLSDEIQNLAADIAAETVAAETVTVSRDGTTLIVDKRKIELARLRRILNQIEAQVTRFGGTVQSEVALAQALGVDLGAEDALNLMELSLPDLPPEVSQAVTSSFARLPAEAIEAAAGLLAEESPLTAKLSRDFGRAVRDQVERHLLEGIAAGRNPRVIARRLAKNLEDSAGAGLRWAMTTVRTAQIKSYQTANHMTYMANSEIVPTWIWHAQLDSRTCMSCISQHGSEHPYTERLNDHHNGRCAPIPKAITYADLGLDIKSPEVETQTGEEWFKKQPAKVQREMMGPGKYEAWKAGEFEFEELSQPYEDDVYGELFREATLKELTE